MKSNLHLVPTTAPIGAAPASAPDLAVEALEKLTAAARQCRGMGLTVAGAVFGNGSPRPALQVVAGAKTRTLLERGLAWDDGRDCTPRGEHYRKGSMIVAGVLVFWHDYLGDAA